MCLDINIINERKEKKIFFCGKGLHLLAVLLLDSILHRELIVVPMTDKINVGARQIPIQIFETIFVPIT